MKGVSAAPFRQHGGQRGRNHARTREKGEAQGEAAAATSSTVDSDDGCRPVSPGGLLPTIPPSEARDLTGAGPKVDADSRKTKCVSKNCGQRKYG